MKKLKIKKNEMLRRNSPVIEFVESVLRPEEIVYMVGNRF